MPVILGTQEIEIRKIVFQSQPWRIVHQALSRNTLPQNRAGGVAPAEVSGQFKQVLYMNLKKLSRMMRNLRLFFTVWDNPEYSRSSPTKCQ
jgi:hypothetical protein